MVKLSVNGHPSRLTKVTILALVATFIAGFGYSFVKQKIREVRTLEKTKAYQSLHHFYRNQLLQAVSEPVLVIGNSHIQSLLAQRIAPGAINLGIGGDTIQGVTARLRDYLHITPDSTVVVLVGTNNLLRESAMESINRLPGLALPLEGSPAVFWVAVPYSDGQRIPDTEITQFNESVRKICLSMNHCRFLPGLPAVAEENSFLTADGIHLTTAGYEHLTSLIRQDIMASSRATQSQGDARAPQNL